MARAESATALRGALWMSKERFTYGRLLNIPSGTVVVHTEF
jgi:hypothetical protein